MQSDVPLNRGLIAGIACVCLGLSLAMMLFSTDHANDMWQAAFMKVGVVMGALWLAIPPGAAGLELGKAPLWKVVVGVLMLALLIRVRVPIKLLLPIVLIAAVAIRLLRPKPKPRPPREPGVG